MNIFSYALVVMVLLLGLSAKNAQAVESDELVRASIIEKIARFIEWPSWQDEQFTLCVLEKSALLPALQSYYESGILGDKPVSLQLFKLPGLPKKCQAVFLGEEQLERVPEIVKLLRNAPVLVLAEGKNAVDMGAHVDFYTEDDRLHLEVNRKSLKINGFKVSFHLLKVARIVE